MNKTLFPVLWMMVFTGASLRCNAQDGTVPSLDFAWAGGLNSCQFCSIDLNLDGIPDLLVFDRFGNRKLTFINQGTQGRTDFKFAPEYSQLLPEMHDWVITADYNLDGKMDIFTYGTGGIRVFRNTSSGSLSFHLQTDMLESWYYSGYVGILVTSVDYPAISDIDGDGDLDLLTFFGLGSFVEYHKNLSMEKFGNADSLDYRLNDHCWGKFRESEGGNRITLNAPCPYAGDSPPAVNPPLSPPKHTGSTLLATDLNGDGLSDLLVGDVDFPNLIQLMNGGTRDSALMISQDSLFPSYDRPVHLNSFPALSFLDLDNDGIKDLVASPFDPNYYISENKKSVWYYKNTGSNTYPHFVFQTDDFLQSGMFDFGSNSFPTAADLDSDGLPDLVIGNYGYYDSSRLESGYLRSYFTSSLAFLKNTGSSGQPLFELFTTDLAGASKLNMHALNPCIYDLNADGWPDMLCGTEDGSLVLFTCRGDSSGIPVYNTPVKNYQQIKAGAFSAPCLFDLDRDGLPDLITGQQNGTLKYYRNTGTAGNPVFSFTLDSLGKVDVTNHETSYYGYSTPWFFRDYNNRTLLLSGSEEGRFHLYAGIDGNINGKFTEIDSLKNFIGIQENPSGIGWRTSGVLVNLTDPRFYDLVCGNFSGGMNYITRGNAPGIRETLSPTSVMKLNIFPNPASDEIRVEPAKNRDYPSGYESINFSQGKCFLKITDLLGVMIRSERYVPGEKIGVHGLSAGIYILILEDTLTGKQAVGKLSVLRNPY